MPEYLAPGVYVEEVSYRAKSIEGVSTTTTGFIGPTKYGPVDLEPDIVTSLGEYEQVYGDRSQFEFSGLDGPMHNYMWHAARAFFEEGGKRLYVSRVFHAGGDDGLAEYVLPPADAARPDGGADLAGANLTARLHLSSRFPGITGNMTVRLSLRVGRNIHVVQFDNAVPPAVTGHDAIGLHEFDVVLLHDPDRTMAAVDLTAGACFVAEVGHDVQGNAFWSFHADDPAFPHPIELNRLGAGVTMRVVTMTITTVPSTPQGREGVWEHLPLDPRHQRDGSPNSVFATFGPWPANRSQARSLPIVIEAGTALTSGDAVIRQLLTMQNMRGGSLLAALLDEDSLEADRSVQCVLSGGNDGARPTASDYEGGIGANDEKTGLVAFEDLEDISIVAAPGSTFEYEGAYQQEAQAIVGHLISHAQRMRYRIAVLDAGDGQTVQAVRAMRARLDSSHAALYYPWVRVLDPVTRREINLPPSGCICGIYARNDIQRAVYKAPANEVVNTALGFERLINKGQQEVLNPEGINCLRFFEGRGFRVWGARTVSSDPEWKYVNLRRYFAYLERSIEKGTQWAVFEPNGEALWANVRRTIEDFLLNEWQMGALLGDKPEKAYFVRCDRTTMTQNDLDNGRLVCLIGVAPLRPAEFVIFRIGQWTADKR
jgi:hypothetical protein